MKHVIIGSGVAGMTAALSLSRYDDAEIHLYTDEPYSYYYRPQVTNFLADVMPFDKVVRRPTSWYAKRGIQMHLESPVTEIRPDERQIKLHDGTLVPYDRLLLTAGSCPFVPPIDGTEKRGVFTLRTLDDAVQIKEYAADSERAVVVGGGLLGLEAARGLEGMGLDVTIVELLDWLMPVQLDEEGGALLGEFVEGQGYTVLTSSSLDAITGEGRVEGVVITGDRSRPTDMVLIAAGVRPNLALARKAGLEIGRAVAVNDRMETSAPHVYAAGDVASFEGGYWAIVPVAQAQAQVAAANMAGEETLYEPVVPSTALKVMNIDVNSMGNVDPKESEGLVQIRRSQPDAQVYRKIVLRDGKIVGAILINAKALAKELSGLVEEHAEMTREEASALLEG